ncbi:MAG: FecR domain-containing protein [Bdellovibrionales bacterium]
MNVCIQGIIIGIIFAFTGLAHAQSVHGVLRVVKGDVTLKSAKTGKTARARIGEKVFPKDIIMTGKDSRAKVVMVDKNEINISPESQLEIKHYEYDPNQGKKDVLLNVIYGKVRSKVEQKYDGKSSKFQIKTPSAVAGVRGTDFMTSFNPSNGNSQVVTFHGAVEFGLPGPGGSIQNAVTVTPGTFASATAGQSPTPPAPVPKEELAKMERESSAEPPKTEGSDSRTPAAEGEKEKKDEKGDKAEKGEGSEKKAEGKKGDGKQPPPGQEKKDQDNKDNKDQAKQDGGGKAEGGKADAAKSDGAKAEGGKPGDAKGDGGKGQGGGKSGPSGEKSAGQGGANNRAPAGAPRPESSNTRESGGAPGPVASPGPGSGTPPPPPTGDMFRPEDFAGGPGAPPPPLAAPMMPGGMMPPPLTPITQMPVCDFCTRLIEENQTRLIIRVNQQ